MKRFLICTILLFTALVSFAGKGKYVVIEGNKTIILRILLTAFLFLFCIVTNAQEITDRVEMKSGSIIYGTVIEQNFSEKRIKIQTVEGSILVFNMSDVKGITKTQKEYDETASKVDDYSNWTEENTLDDDPYNRKGNGLYKKCRFLADLGFGYGVKYEDNKENRYGISYSIGYQFNPFIFLGGGFGHQRFYKNETTAVPLFLNFRTDFVNKIVTPFFDLKIGYSPWGDFNKAGYASFGLGVRIAKINLSIASDALAQSIDSGSYYTYCHKYGYKIDNDSDILTLTNVFMRFGVEF